MVKFAGFTPEQQYTLLQKQGYQGPMREDVMALFMQSNPGVAAKMGKYAETAQKKLMEMGNPTQEKEFATGGSVPFSFEQYKAMTNYRDPTQKGYQDYLDKYTSGGTASSSTSGPTPDTFDGTEVPEDQQGEPIAGTGDTTGVLQQVASSSNDITEQALSGQGATKASVATADPNTGQISESTGQITTPIQQAEAQQVEQTAQAQMPEYFDPAKFDPSLIGDDVKNTLSEMEAAQGEVTKEMTVQGQLEGLLSQFEDGTPPWAAGAMREAMGVMQQRGLGASSMAGQAVVQAAMESALPIAMQDAKTYAQMEFQNLNNRQQTLIFKTQQTLASMFSDQAAENAAKQFNAASENQVRQFFASLQDGVSRFNAAQINGIAQFNAGARNSVEMFNKQLQEAREQFNAQNAVVISQSNAQLRTQITMANTAAQNAANMQYAQASTGLTAAAMDQVWQKERDLMTMAFTAAENQLDRDAEIAMSKLTAKQQQDYADSVGKGQVVGTIVGAAAEGIFGSIF